MTRHLPLRIFLVAVTLVVLACVLAPAAGADHHFLSTSHWKAGSNPRIIDRTRSTVVYKARADWNAVVPVYGRYSLDWAPADDCSSVEGAIVICIEEHGNAGTVGLLVDENHHILRGAIKLAPAYVNDYFVVAHELGHGLGLAHHFNPGYASIMEIENWAPTIQRSDRLALTVLYGHTP